MTQKLISSIAQSGTFLLFSSFGRALSNTSLTLSIFPLHSSSTSSLAAASSSPTSPSAASLSRSNNSRTSPSNSPVSLTRLLSRSSHLSFRHLNT